MPDRRNFMVVLDFDQEQRMRFVHDLTPFEAAHALLVAQFPEAAEQGVFDAKTSYEELLAWCDEVQACLNVVEMGQSSHEPRYSI